MYAVVRSGGKQHRIEPGKTFKVERLDGEVGSKIELKEVLMVSDEGKVTIGAPLIEKATVQATVTAQDRAKKIRIFKKKRKKQYRRTTGHRQDFTQLLVDNIKL
jgi:large subunit ribosomal protein L21